MGAANWLAGGVNRAVSGVRSALPGSAQGVEEQQQDQPARSLHAAPEPEEPTAQRHQPASEPDAGAPDSETAEVASGSAEREPRVTTPESEPVADKPSSAEPAAEVEPDTEAEAPASSQAGWSKRELTEFRAALEADIVRLREELNMGQADLAEMLDHSDPAGDDQADAGAQTLEREQEMSVAANAEELLEQSRHALHRLDAGTYGICESCGRSIPAARLRAFPRATLCIPCKQLEERG